MVWQMKENVLISLPKMETGETNGKLTHAMIVNNKIIIQ